MASLKKLMARGNFGLPTLVINAGGQSGSSVTSATPSEAEQASNTDSIKPTQLRPPSPVQPGQVAPIINRLLRPESADGRRNYRFIVSLCF